MHRYYGHFTNVTNCVARKSLTVTGAAGRNHHRAGLGGTRTSECPALSAFASYLSQLSLVLEVEHATGEEGDGLLRVRG